MNRTLTTLLAAALMVPGSAALAGCESDDAAREDLEDAGQKLDDASGRQTDEKAKDAADDAVDAVDDDDGK